ncbi:MAG: class IV adenylate cyclase [Ignisphaera sp.]|nr:class IV adenylate cyclase [Ignisphaera sp.]MCX8168059.1 class IV adenylate cyclase [Ignisphaera sp.]MDW8085752.1 class IV adenylate cyclase [Ignisphaera sp.]
MHTEYEAKVRVEDLDAVEERLKAVGAQAVDVAEEEDAYIDLNPCIDVVSRDVALRVRVYRSLLSGRERYELTYKGPRKSRDLKIRSEITVAVDNGYRVLEMLRELGFTKHTTVYKRRKIYRYGAARVFLDDVKGLGKFVEIEVEGVKSVEEFRRVVAEILDILNLPKQLIPKSYLEMVLEKS